MNWKVQSKWYDGNKTNAILTNDSPYMSLTALLDGDVLKKTDEELIQLGLDYVFKTVFVEKAMPEAIVKVDETSKAVEELKSLMVDAEALITRLVTETSKLKEENAVIKKSIVNVKDLDPSTKEELINTYPAFVVGSKYAVGEVFNFEGKLYQVIQEHTSQGDWNPSSTASLYKEYLNLTTEVNGETVEVISDWKQPTGAHDAYKTGDKVTFENKVYESLIDANTWSPTGYPQGWKLV